MSVIRNLEPIKNTDFTLRRVKVEKNHNVSYEELTDPNSGYLILHAEHSSILPEPSNENFGSGKKNTALEVKKRTLWHQLDHLFYRDVTEVNSYPNYYNNIPSRFLNYSASVISVPHLKYGEKIKPGTVEIIPRITEDTFLPYYKDDGNGHLIEVAYYSDYVNLSNKYRKGSQVGYWSFSELFRFNKFTTGYILNEKYIWKSEKFSSREFISTINNVKVENGPWDNGLSLSFPSNDSYVLTPHNVNFNFDINSEFTIQFWVKPIESPIEFQSLISKKGVVKKDLSGLQKVESTLTGKDLERDYISTQYINEEIDRYPFDFYINPYNEIVFARSDGTNITEVSASLKLSQDNSPRWNQISLIRYKDNDEFKIKLIVNGGEPDFNEEVTVTDNTIHTNNDHCIIFGNVNMNSSESDTKNFTGNISEIRFINNVVRNNSGALDITNFYNKFYQSDMIFYTNIVGNVFYDAGIIVLSSRDNIHHDMFKINDIYQSNGIDLKFKSTHHIYSYETVCRIPKGSFNLTMNPTARITPESDVLIEEFKSNLTSGSLRPYADSIGLYNDTGDLVAIAKFGQPVQMRDDVDINVIVKWDA